MVDITRLRPGLLELRNGDEIPDWDDPDELEYVATALAPKASNEVNDGRTAVTTTHELYQAADIDVAATDRLVIDDETFEVVGEPATYRNPFAGFAGTVVQLRKVAG